MLVRREERVAGQVLDDSLARGRAGDGQPNEILHGRAGKAQGKQAEPDLVDGRKEPLLNDT